MRHDALLLLARLRPLAEPLVGFAFFAWCMVVFSGALSLDNVGMRRTIALWMTLIGLIGLSVALSRRMPAVAIGVSLAVIVIQVVWPIARFWKDGWPVYSGLALVALSLGLSAPARLRRTAAVFVGLIAVLSSALMTIPALGSNGWALVFGYSASQGEGTALRNFCFVLAIAMLAYFGSWLLGCFVRYRRALPVASRSSDALDALTAREREVFDLAARGMTNPEIASELYVSEATVKSHMTSILTKLAVSSRAGLIALAHENSLMGVRSGG
jgi:DNA-binding CsgD family transcriptional regulator